MILYINTKKNQTTISKYYLDHRIYVLLKGIHVINTGENSWCEQYAYCNIHVLEKNSFNFFYFFT